MTSGFGSYVRIISAFLPKPRQGFTIRRLAAQCAGSYGWAHSICLQLIGMGVLRSQRVGPLNPESDLAIGLLALATAIQTLNVLKADPALAARARLALAACANPHRCVLSTPEGMAVVDDGCNQAGVVNCERLRSVQAREIPALLKQQAVVLQGFELAWRLALMAPRQ